MLSHTERRQKLASECIHLSLLWVAGHSMAASSPLFTVKIMHNELVSLSEIEFKSKLRIHKEGRTHNDVVANVIFSFLNLSE